MTSLMQPIQDTINFELTVEKVIVNDTVKMVANIEALVTTEQSDGELRAEIRTTMKKFIDTDWQFSNLQRRADSAGFERVSLQASARVSETENYNLDARAREVSRPGLTVSYVQVDTSVPQARIDAAEQEMRLALLAKATDEATKVADLTRRSYRVHTVNFNTQADISLSNRSKGITLTNGMTYGSGFSDEGGLGNAQKLTMRASVALAAELL